MGHDEITTQATLNQASAMAAVDELLSRAALFTEERGMVSVATEDGEIEWGAVQIPVNTFNEIVNGRMSSITFGDDYISLELGDAEGPKLNIHIYRSKDKPKGKKS